MRSGFFVFKGHKENMNELEEIKLKKSQEAIKHRINKYLAAKYLDAEDPELIEDLAAFNKQYKGVVYLRYQLGQAKLQGLDFTEQEAIHKKAYLYLCNLEMPLLERAAQELYRALCLETDIRESDTSWKLIRKYTKTKQSIRNLKRILNDLDDTGKTL